LTYRLALLFTILLLAACGGGEDISEPDAGGGYQDKGRERIAVLGFEQQIDASPELQDIPIVLPPPYRNRDWPQSGGTAANVSYHLALPDRLTRAWRTNIGRGSDLIARQIMPPVVENGRIYTIDTRGLVTALNTANGEPLWERRLRLEGARKAMAMGGGLAVREGRVYVTTGFGFISCLDGRTGEEIWRYSNPIPFRGAPTLFGQRLFAVTQDNQIVALNIESGSLLWTQAGLPEESALLGAASPAVDNETVVAALSSGELVALRVENGRQVWQDTLSRTRRLTPLASLGDIDGNPVIEEGRVYAVGHAGRMVAINLRSGERVWENDVSGVHTPVIAGQFIFMITADGDLVSVLRSDGRIRWVTRLQRFKELDKREGPIHWTGPVLAGDRLIVASSHGFLLSISPYSGNFLGARELPDAVVAPPVVADGTLYVLTEGGDLIAYR